MQKKTHNNTGLWEVLEIQGLLGGCKCHMDTTDGP